MERNSTGPRSAQFRVKYREAALHSGPSGIAGYLGTLHKGAVMEVLADNDPYYYFVRLDNGLEGYVYKASGEITSGLFGGRLGLSEAVSRESQPPASSLSPAPALDNSTPIEPARPGRFDNGSVPPPARPRMPAARPAAVPPPARSSNGAGSRANLRGGRSVVITTSEIAVFDKPGIVGRQVGKLRRGEQVALVNQDSFFFEVTLNNGLNGFIPRYAGELS